ncbi:SEC-C metal-binding domain-containing protein, partial [Sphingomonas oligophenolica]
DERTASFIGLFVGFMDMLEDIEEREDADELRDEHAALMPRALVGMRKLALMREGNARALTSMKATKVGRNAPCPCGSGQKFKRCCGAN